MTGAHAKRLRYIGKRSMQSTSRRCSRSSNYCYKQTFDSSRSSWMSWSVGSPSFRKESRLPSLAGVPWARPVLQRLATPVVWVDECHTLCYRPQRNQDHPWSVTVAVARRKVPSFDSFIASSPWWHSVNERRLCGHFTAPRHLMGLRCLLTPTHSWPALDCVKSFFAGGAADLSAVGKTRW